MALNVSWRIGGGFMLLLVLMALLGITALINYQHLTAQLQRINQQNLPQLRLSSDLSQELQQLNLTLLQHAHSKDEEQRTALQQQIDQLYPRIHSHLQQLSAQQAAEQTQMLDGLHQQSQRLQQQAGKQIALHNQWLASTEQVQQQLNQALDNAAELEDALSSLQDYADSDQQQWAAAAMAEEAGFILSSISWIGRTQHADKLQPEQKRFNSSLEKIQQQLPSQDEDSQEELTEFINALQRINTESGLIAAKKQLLALSLQRQQSLSRLAELSQSTRPLLSALQQQVQQQAELSQQAANDTVATGRWWVILSLLAGAGFAALISWQVIRSIKQPLTQLSQLMHHLSEGQLTERCDLQRKDEFGQLIRWSNQLADTWQQLITAIHQQAGDIHRKADDSAQLSQQCASNSEVQQQDTDNVASAISQMNQAIEEVAARASLSSDHSGQINQLTQHCNNQLALNNQQVKELTEQLEQAQQVVISQQNNSQQIDAIVEVIEGIANQTNLLALNAAIEAARAGDMGRGFAVVAEEVRSLAISTQQSTQQIQQMVELIQRDAETSTTLIDSSYQHAQRCSAQTAEISQSLQQIHAKLTDVDNLSTEIAAATEQQSATCATIDQRLLSIAQQAQQSLSFAQRSAAQNSDLVVQAASQQRQLQVFKT